MIQSVEIHNLRGIADGKVEGLSPLTILLGVNNSGKSTILEALHLGVPSEPGESLGLVAARRGWLGLVGLKYLFHAQNAPTAIEARCEGYSFAGVKSELALADPSTKKRLSDQYGCQGLDRPDCLMLRYSVDWAQSSQPHYGDYGVTYLFIDPEPCQVAHRVDGRNDVQWPATVFVDLHALVEHPTLEDAFSETLHMAGLDFEDHLFDLVKPLWPTEPKRLRILTEGERSILHVVGRTGSSPVQFAGDGVKRLLHAACLMAKARDGVVLLEEPECFQHAKALQLFAQVIWRAVAAGTQVILSTHSLEFLEVLMRVEGVDLEKLALIRTALAEGALSTQRIPGADAKARLSELGEDLRR